jgi:hypothetical protein
MINNLRNNPNAATERTVQETPLLKARVLILNIVDFILKEYTVSEAGFLRKPITLLTCYLASESHRNARHLQLTTELTLDTSSDPDPKMWISSKPYQGDYQVETF